MAGRRKGYNYQKIDIDLSILRGPLSLPEEGVLQIIKCIQSGTSEIRETLLFEIDVIYECRVCRGLFRSLTNLLAHKRVYCQEKFKDTKLEFVPSYSENETVVVQPEAPEDDKEEKDEQKDEAGQKNAKPVIEQMAEGEFEGHSEPYNFYTKAVERQQEKEAERTTAVVTLQRISCNPNAVYQTCRQANSENHTNIRGKKRRQSSKDSEEEEDEDDNDWIDDKDSSKDKTETSVKDESSMDHMDVVTIQPEAASGPLRMNLRQRSGGEVTTPIIISLSQRADCEVKTKTCLICNTQYSSLKTLHFHMINCHSEKRTIYPCLYCSQEFTQMLGVTRHLSRVHHKSKETIEKLRLTLRKKAYSKPLEEIKEEKLDKTEKILKKKEESVPKRIPQKTHITMHTVRGQQGSAPDGALPNFKCIHCSKLFTKQESLDRHASFCFTSQATMGQLSGTDLPKNLHGNMEETMETGSSTDMGRWTTSDLSTEDAKQLSNMINEETLTCLKCDQSYSNISNLHRHAVRHLGRTRFKCRLCHYTAYNRSECKTHLRRVHPGRVFDEDELNRYILDFGLEKSKTGSHSRSPSPTEEIPENSQSRSNSAKPSTYMDHLTTLRTRSGLYIKPRFAVKRKAEDDDSIEEGKIHSEKRVRGSSCDDDMVTMATEAAMATEGQQHDSKESDEVFVLDSGDSQDSAMSEQIDNPSGSLSVYQMPDSGRKSPKIDMPNQSMICPRVPSLIIKKVSLSESCILQQSSKSDSCPAQVPKGAPGPVSHNSVHPEDHLVRPSSPSCSSRSRDTSPDIMLEQDTPKEKVCRDWADVWSSKSDDGEEEFLGFRLVSDAQGVSAVSLQKCHPAICKLKAEKQVESNINAGDILNKDRHVERSVIESDAAINSGLNVQSVTGQDDLSTKCPISEIHMRTSEMKVADKKPTACQCVTGTEFKCIDKTGKTVCEHSSAETAMISSLDSAATMEGDTKEVQREHADSVQDCDLNVKSTTVEVKKENIEIMHVCAHKSVDVDDKTDNVQDCHHERHTDVKGTEDVKIVKDRKREQSAAVDDETENVQACHHERHADIKGETEKVEIVKDRKHEWSTAVDDKTESTIKEQNDDTGEAEDLPIAADEMSQKPSQENKDLAGLSGTDRTDPGSCEKSGGNERKSENVNENVDESQISVTDRSSSAEGDDIVMEETAEKSDTAVICTESGDSVSKLVLKTEDSASGDDAVTSTTELDDGRTLGSVSSDAKDQGLISQPPSSEEDKGTQSLQPEGSVSSGTARKEHDHDSAKQTPTIIIHSADDELGDKSQEKSEGKWKSGFLIPEIIICPPSVSACSDESDELNEADNNREISDQTGDQGSSSGTANVELHKAEKQSDEPASGEADLATKLSNPPDNSEHPETKAAE